MDNENHKSTWNNFTKFVLWGTVGGHWSFGFNGNILTIRSMHEDCIRIRKSKI